MRKNHKECRTRVKSAIIKQILPQESLYVVHFVLLTHVALVVKRM